MQTSLSPASVTAKIRALGLPLGKYATRREPAKPGIFARDAQATQGRGCVAVMALSGAPEELEALATFTRWAVSQGWLASKADRARTALGPNVLADDVRHGTVIFWHG